MPKETVGEWQARKKAQAARFMKRDPSLSLDDHGDHETRFVLVHQRLGTAIRFGQLPRRAGGQPRVDLTDEQIEEWAKPLRIRPIWIGPKPYLLAAFDSDGNRIL